MYTGNFPFLVLLCGREVLEQCTLCFSMTEILCFKCVVKFQKCIVKANSIGGKIMMELESFRFTVFFFGGGPLGM